MAPYSLPFSRAEKFPFIFSHKFKSQVSSLVEIQRGDPFTTSKSMFTILLPKNVAKAIFFPLKTKSEKLGPISPNDQGYKNSNVA